MLIRMTALLALISPFTVADVQFLKPAGGDIVQAGSLLSVTWQDSKTSPPLSDLLGYTILLMVGGDTVATSQQVPTTPSSIAGAMSAGTSVAFTIPATAGPPDKNAYFLQITSAPSSGTGIVVNYSQRFTVSGMTGTWPSTAIQAAYTATGGTLTAVPPTSNTVANNNNNAPAGAGSGVEGPYSVSFQDQTGPTLYAPMQLRPGSTITQTNTAPLFPASSFTIAATYLPPPTIVTTVTQAVTFSATTIENPASPAPMPSDDMQKFLNRWKD